MELTKHTTQSSQQRHEPDVGSGTMTAVDLGIAVDPAQEAPLHDINGFNILALGFNICNSWIGMASSLAIGIAMGGTVTVLYGAVLTTIIYLATAATLAELSAV